MLSSVQYLGCAAYVSPAGAIDAHDSDDVAGGGLVDFFALIGVHQHDPTEAFLTVGALVVVGVALLDAALINASECQLAEWIIDNLEGHSDKGLVGIGNKHFGFAFAFAGDGLDFPVQRRRQVADHGVDQRLHADVLDGGAEEDRRQPLASDGFASHAHGSTRAAGIFFGEQQLHQFVAVHRQGFEHLMAKLFGDLDVFGRDFFLANFRAVIAIEVQRLHLDQVDDALEVLAGAHRGTATERRRNSASLATREPLGAVRRRCGPSC